MLSIATAAVHRSMRPKTPSPGSSASTLVGANHPWSTEHTPSPKRRRMRQGSCSARKKIITSPVEEVPINFEFDNPEITLTLVRKSSFDQFDNKQHNETVNNKRYKTKSTSSEPGESLELSERIDCGDRTTQGKRFKSNSKSVVISFLNSSEISIKPVNKQISVTSNENVSAPESSEACNVLQQSKTKTSILLSSKTALSEECNSTKPKELSEPHESDPMNKDNVSNQENCVSIPVTAVSKSSESTQSTEKPKERESLTTKLARAVNILKAFEKRSVEVDSAREVPAEEFEYVPKVFENEFSEEIEQHPWSMSESENKEENWDQNDDVVLPKPCGSGFVSDDLFLLTDSDLDIPYYMVGFPNPPGENRCWLNATLHALFALPLLENMKNINLDDSSQLIKTLIAMQIFWKKGTSEKQKTYQTVKMFKEELSILDESYPSERQQDVSEFLMIFLNYIRSDIDKLLVADAVMSETENIPENRQDSRRIPKTPHTPGKRQPLADISCNSGKRSCAEGTTKPRKLTYGVQDLLSPKSTRLSNPTDPSYKVHTPPHSSSTTTEMIISKNPIDEYFLLHMMENYMCKGCLKHRQKKVDNLMLYVDLPSETEGPAVSLEDAIKKSLAPEDRNLTCGTCKFDVHTMRTTFRRWPRVLTVQVNRYGMTDGLFSKISTAVTIPESLVLDNNLVDSVSVAACKYEPTCIIAHVGSTMDCGHYTSYVNHNSQWFHYNDMNVTPMTSSEALGAADTTAYLVFFVAAQIPEVSDSS
ncbi:uncharacterized protein LOC107271365 isoform X2 [Cephus cinctus]|uniref:Uncharacterized protein LOC107271365 isoform X2 n=1 Tax=Cephus cinctus TaxID=211228 RepID=A0AAJ7RNQ4_CEPCN|nr:uncharacterized protein LOC107271365 isoform X2 [Cephus cinctus]